ncbi:MAG: hypothetical protein ACK41D_02290 [Rubricoccaceae bacterium]
MDLSRLSGTRAHASERGSTEKKVSDRPLAEKTGAAAAAAEPRSGDRVELSATARMRQAAEATRQAEIEAARAQLAELNTLSPERVAELRALAQSGYYDRPEVVESVAARIAGA